MGDPPPKTTNVLLDVPEVVIARLPQYMRVLNAMSDAGTDVISSHQLGEQIRVTPAQIRKDLSYLGRFGTQGKGYSVRHLASELRQILGLNKQWNVCLVGVGRLGRAILSYPGFAPEGFEILAAFDVNRSTLGQVVGKLTIQPLEELQATVSRLDIRIGILAVPGNVAQEVTSMLTDCQITAILNYAPTYAQVPAGVRVRNIDPVLALQSMTYYLSHPV